MTHRVAAGMCVAGLICGLVLVGMAQPGGGDKAAPAAAAASAGAGPVTVRVCGLMVVGDAYGKGNEIIRPLNASESGVRLAVLASVANGELAGFVAKDSSLTSFADDKGGNLLAGGDDLAKPGFDPAAQRAVDNKAMIVELRSMRAPAAGASQIVAEGELALRYSPSGKRESARLTNTALKAGTKLKAGPIAFEISVAAVRPGGDGFEVQFRSTQDLSGLAGVKFIDSLGKPIDAVAGPQLQVNFMGVDSHTATYSLTRKVERATIVVEYWGDIQTIKVPVKLRTGVGL